MINNDSDKTMEFAKNTITVLTQNLKQEKALNSELTKRVKELEEMLNDLKRQENDHDFPYSFNEERMNHVCSFIENLHHWKGALARKHFILDPWQVFVVGNIFGWEDAAVS